ncbi:MAG: WD40 repeat domain-containing serine/threonine protein kinase, partial [Planctomycetota bacterium]
MEGASILEELRDVVHLSDEDAARLELEAAKLIEEAGGDPRLALGARGGIDRTIHLELSRVAAPLVAKLAEEGAGARGPLREVSEERYLGFQEIARGGMGVVYLAVDTELNRRVAMKVVRPDWTEAGGSPLSMTPPGPDTPASEAFRLLTARFLQEAWITGGLEHPGIVPVYELGRTPAGIPYYTMRFVRGERTLERAIDEAETLEDRLALLEPFLKVCDTLAYAHSRGVAHRDLKPANVILGEFGEVVLIDWGLAKLKDRPDLSKSRWQARVEELRESESVETLRGGIGTPGYMAPEAVLGDPEGVDERSDVYSLGSVLYRVLTGRLPHEFESFPELLSRLLEEDPSPPHDEDPAVPEELSRICLGALSRDREARTRTVQELAGSIRGWQRESAMDREVVALLEQARAAWEDAEGLEGEALLRQIDRVLVRAGRALELRPAEPEALSLVERAESMRARALAERERAARRSLLRRGAVAGLVLMVAAAAVVAWLLDAKRRQAEEAEERAALARSQAEEALQAKGRALRRARSLALVNASALAQGHHPMRALLLARSASRFSQRPQIMSRLRGAIVGTRERKLLRGHEERVSSAVFSPSGDRILTASDDKTARLWSLTG